MNIQHIDIKQLKKIAARLIKPDNRNEINWALERLISYQPDLTTEHLLNLAYIRDSEFSKLFILHIWQSEADRLLRAFRRVPRYRLAILDTLNKLTEYAPELAKSIFNKLPHSILVKETINIENSIKPQSTTGTKKATQIGISTPQIHPTLVIYGMQHIPAFAYHSLKRYVKLSEPIKNEIDAVIDNNAVSEKGIKRFFAFTKNIFQRIKSFLLNITGEEFFKKRNWDLPPSKTLINRLTGNNKTAPEVSACHSPQKIHNILTPQTKVSSSPQREYDTPKTPNDILGETAYPTPSTPAITASSNAFTPSPPSTQAEFPTPETPPPNNTLISPDKTRSPNVFTLSSSSTQAEFPTPETPPPNNIQTSNTFVGWEEHFEDGRTVKSVVPVNSHVARALLGAFTAALDTSSTRSDTVSDASQTRKVI